MTGFVLKLIAILSMLIDHTAAVFNLKLFSYDTYIAMRYIGRIAFPIFCFLIVEGAIYTHNISKYLLRLGIFALISEIPFDLALRGKIFYFEASNVFFTLFLGLFAISVSQLMTNDISLSKKGSIELSVMPRVAISISALVISCLISYLLSTDYTVGGVLIIYCMYILHDKPVISYISMALILLVFFGTIEAWGLFAIPLFFIYNQKRGLNNKIIQYLFYVFYPLHLLILWCISLII